MKKNNPGFLFPFDFTIFMAIICRDALRRQLKAIREKEKQVTVPYYFYMQDQSKYLENIWSTLNQRRREGETYPLRILILGPSNDGTIEYETRCNIRDKLQALGHGAFFPEELSIQSGAWSDELLAEIVMQAQEAHVIIMIYRTRGTQSERDILMNDMIDNPCFAQKAIIFVEEEMYSKIKESLTGQDWERMRKVSDVQLYNVNDLPDKIVKKAEDITQKLRRKVYVRNLLKGAIT
ncbi:MAG: hypothetical protein WC496_02940 [Phycisphaerae bacterium]|jgi:hypothetical protein